jgi:hypothetical protein
MDAASELIQQVQSPNAVYAICHMHMHMPYAIYAIPADLLPLASFLALTSLFPLTPLSSSRIKTVNRLLTDKEQHAEFMAFLALHAEQHKTILDVGRVVVYI